MSNRYIRQSLEREMILAGVGEKEVSTFINSSVEKALAGRTWLLLHLNFEEMLVCSKCENRINEEIAHLGLCDGKIDEVLCDACWKTMSEWRKDK